MYIYIETFCNLNRISQFHIYSAGKKAVLIVVCSGFQGKKEERCWYNPLVTLSIISNQCTLGVGESDCWCAKLNFTPSIPFTIDDVIMCLTVFTTANPSLKSLCVYWISVSF